jgi:hypothetical protein
MEEKKLTVKDIYSLCQGNCLLQVVSAYNNKVLCKNYHPDKHGKISNRVVYDIRPACKVQGEIWCLAYLVVSVNGKEEYEEEQRKKAVE